MNLFRAIAVLCWGLVAQGGCASDKCEGLEAQARIAVRLGGVAAGDVARTEVSLKINGGPDLTRGFDAPEPSFVLKLGNGDRPPRGLLIHVVTLDSKGDVIGEGELSTTFSADGCNDLVVTVRPGGGGDGRVVDGAVDAGPADGTAADGAPADSTPADGPPADGPPADAVLPDALPLCGDGGCTAGFVLLPAGKFTMGSPSTEACRRPAETEHEVTLTRPFEIQSAEVTQEQFEQLMKYNPSYFGPGGAGANCGKTCPVEMVTWHEAAAYCNALSTKQGLPKCYYCSGSQAASSCTEEAAYSGATFYDCPGYRLPTEAEWEYAYRAGTTTAYYNGDSNAAVCGCEGDPAASAIGWYCKNGKSTTHPVKALAPNDWGLYDMAGNVNEWCNDHYVYEDLGSAPVTDPSGPSSGPNRVLRGGAWTSGAALLRAAYRYVIVSAGEAKKSRGFRCVRTR